MKFSTLILASALSLSSPITCTAFVAPSFSSPSVSISSSPASCRIVSTSTMHRMASTADDDEEEEEPLSDELSKLIGKRASLRTSASSSKPKTIPSDNKEGSIIDPSIETLYEGKSGMDMFEMPDFKNARPLKTPKETEDKARGGGSDDKDDDFYLDYAADFDDENDLHIPNRMGFSTVAWGDKSQGFKTGKKLKKKDKRLKKYLAGDLQMAYDKLMEAGIILIDTAENYGLDSRSKSLSAENIISQCLDSNSALPIVATTMSNPWRSLKQGTGFRFGGAAIHKAIEGSAERLGTSAIDIYSVPAKMFYPGAPGVVTDALCAATDSGLINNVGVNNMSKDRMKSFNKKLLKKGEFQLVTNSFEFSLVNRKAWKSGLIAACKDQGVIPVVRNPLGDGLASGIWTSANPTGGEVSKKQPFDFKTLDQYTTLHDVLASVQKKVQDRIVKENSDLKDRRSRYGGPPVNTKVSTSQIAINYVVAKGCVPVPSVKNVEDADEIIGCLGWGLTKDEVKLLDNAADMSDKGRVV